jgi:hypothetical protein
MILNQFISYDIYQNVDVEKTSIIKYGIPSNYIDVTDVALSKCLIDNRIIIPENDHRRADLFGDPVPFIIKSIYVKKKYIDIIIYPHLSFNLSDGGTTVQYYFAKLLIDRGLNIKIYDKDKMYANNKICIDYFNDEKDYIDDTTIVVYCEGIVGNPLGTKRVVRWMLSKLGTNISYNTLHTWNKNELVYFFNSEISFFEKPEKKNTIYKMLSLLYINQDIHNYGMAFRNGYCHTFRKAIPHGIKLTYIHPNDSYEITNQHTQDEYIAIFNEREYFISYDILTFLNIISALCGCISIVQKRDTIDKEQWLKSTAIKEYLTDNNTILYGIAYGNDPEEIQYAKDTLHLVPEQWNNILKYYESHVDNFIKDMTDFENNKNTINNVYFNKECCKQNHKTEQHLMNLKN